MVRKRSRISWDRQIKRSDSDAGQKVDPCQGRQLFWTDYFVDLSLRPVDVRLQIGACGLFARVVHQFEYARRNGYTAIQILRIALKDRAGVDVEFPFLLGQMTDRPFDMGVQFTIVIRRLGEPCWTKRTYRNS